MTKQEFLQMVEDGLGYALSSDYPDIEVMVSIQDSMWKAAYTGCKGSMSKCIPLTCNEYAGNLTNLVNEINESSEEQEINAGSLRAVM